jgi:hypothetical protein
MLRILSVWFSETIYFVDFALPVRNGEAECCSTTANRGTPAFSCSNPQNLVFTFGRDLWHRNRRTFDEWRLIHARSFRELYAPNVNERLQQYV